MLLFVCGAVLLGLRLVVADATAASAAASRPESTDAGARGRMLPVNSDITLDAFGRRWYVKDSRGAKALPGPCVWSGDRSRVWSDGAGIHLTVQPKDGSCQAYQSTEVWLTQPLGYGNYLFKISGPFQHMDPEVTFGLFTWDDDCPGECHFREIDFELARWGNEGDPMAGQWVVQPWSVAGNLKRFSIANAKLLGGQNGPKGGGGCADPGPDGFGGANWEQLTLFMQWFEGGLLRFYVFDGHHDMGGILGAKSRLLTSWEFPRKERVPRPGDERVHLNLWQANWGGTPRYNRRVHVVINGFEHNKQWMDLPAAGIYPAGGRLLAVKPAVEEAPKETAERLKPTPKPKASAPAGAKGATAPEGVEANYAKYSQVLGDWETALKFYNPMPGDKEADASTKVGSEDQRRLQAGVPDPDTDTVVILPGVPAPTPPPGPEPTAGEPAPPQAGAGTGTVTPVDSTTTSTGTAPGTTDTTTGVTDASEDATVGAPVSGGTRTPSTGSAATAGTAGAGAGGVPTTADTEAAADKSKKGMSIGLAVMGAALAAVGVGVAASAARRALKKGDQPILGSGGKTGAQSSNRTLRRTGPIQDSGHASQESGDTTAYASWREPWTAATPDFGQGAFGGGQPGQPSATGEYTGEGVQRQSSGFQQASAGADLPAGAKASGTSPHRTAARHRASSTGYGPYTEGPAEAVAHGHHNRGP